MRCKKLRRILPKYVDGQLSEREHRFVEEHIRDCPACAAESESLERMRSLLQTAGKVEMPDAYWDTYWDRLEKKLPDVPPPVSLTSRMSEAAATLLRRPAVWGRVVVYAFLMIFLIHIAPDRPVKVASTKPPMPTRARSEITKTGTHDKALELEGGVKGAEAEDETTPGRRQIRSRARVAAIPKEQLSGRPLEHAATAAEEDKLAFRFDMAETEGASEETQERFARGEPGKPIMKSATAPERSPAKIEADLREFADSEDEYIAAENYFKEGEYLQAIPAYQNFIEANVKANVDDDRTLKATYQIGEAYYQIGNYPEALSNFAAVADAEVSEAEAKGFAPAVAHFKKRDEDKEALGSKLKEAEIVQKLKAEKESNYERSRRGMASEPMAQQGEDLPETREELISQAIFRQAQSYEHLGNSEEALARYKKYVEKYPKGKYLSQAKDKIAQMGRNGANPPE